jgi:citrate lyase beta subunit
VLGFEGHWASDSETVKLANAAFTPPAGNLERARKILQTVAENPDSGIFEMNGKRILMPQVSDAELLIEKAKRMGIRSNCVHHLVPPHAEVGEPAELSR